MTGSRLSPSTVRTARAISLRLRWLALGLMVAGLVLYGWRADRPLQTPPPQDVRSEARSIAEEFGIQIGVESPEAFQRALSVPLPEDITVTQASPAKVAASLAPLRKALRAYPKKLIQFFLRGVFLADQVIVYDQYPGGGTYGDGAIYLATGFIRSSADAREVELGFHHEFSSLLYLYSGNDASPTEIWEAQNPPRFAYAATDEEEFRAATESVEQPTSQELYEQGFVHPYGRSSKENDINTYAELLMADPDRLVELAREWPRIDAKARILARFYANIDPALAASLRGTAASSLLASLPR